MAWSFWFGLERLWRGDDSDRDADETEMKHRESRSELPILGKEESLEKKSGQAVSCLSGP